MVHRSVPARPEPDIGECQRPVTSAERVPAHWSALDPQPFDVIEAWELNFALGSILKYLVRSTQRTDRALSIEDLRKARHYLEREIGRLERGGVLDALAGES